MSSSRSSSSEPEIQTEKKRKRQVVPEEDELEIDVNAPEPPSKKAKRKEKKDKKSSKKSSKTTTSGDDEDAKDGAADAKPTDPSSKPAAEKRSDHGIWIGNLPWTVTKDTLRSFFTDNAGIDPPSITRLHMPAPQEIKGPRAPAIKPQNKGFAYVDFSGKLECDLAIGLSEKLLGGRKVLIKSAKSFEGRPVLTKEEEDAKKTGAGGAAGVSKKEPSLRLFVGNLGFDVSKEDLEEHFSQAGEVEDVHLATFQDTGKCKGYGWVRFVDLEAAEAAVKGFILKENKDDDDEDDDEDEETKEEFDSDDEKSKPKSRKKRKDKKPRKWFINRLAGRPLRCEFAEDAQTRYKKRFGKAPAEGEGEGGRPARFDRRAPAAEAVEAHEEGYAPRQRKNDPAARGAARREKHQDARMTAPGKALAGTQRGSMAIVEGQGKKTTF